MLWLGEHARIVVSTLTAVTFAIRLASNGSPADRIICGVGILASVVLIAADVMNRMRKAQRPNDR